MKIHIIRADGEEQHVDAPFSTIHELIGANMLDSVNLRDGRVMLVDDAGYDTETVDHGSGHFELRTVRPRRKANTKATALYHAICVPGTTHQIVGDVAIVVDAEVDES